MTKKLMLINVTEDESRIGILENQLLQELLIEHRTREQIKGNIYKGVVSQILPSIQAAFIDFGGEKNGFLSLNDINVSLFTPNGERFNSIESYLKPGQVVMVQVVREATENKGATLTTQISIPGRYMVFMPNSEKGGVSKKIQEEGERDRLRSFLKGIESEENSVIIRTAGIGRDLQELKKDYTMLKRVWGEIQKEYREKTNPCLIFEEDDVVIRTLRDYFTEDIKEVWVDHPLAFQKALNFMKLFIPKKQKQIKLFVGDRTLFSTYGIEKQVQALTYREVKLKSGASIVIDPTEALVAIDVNSGSSTKEKNVRNTALKTNLEATQEIARQLRLRNLGGLVVIDFIDMEKEEHRKKVEESLIEAMKFDKSQHTIGKISQFGLLELSRQRLVAGISKTVESTCPTCHGKGKLPSTLSSANYILRSIRELAAKSTIQGISAELPLQIANHLLNEKRDSITELELEFGIKISLMAKPNVTTVHQNSLSIIPLNESKNSNSIEYIKPKELIETESKNKKSKHITKSQKENTKKNGEHKSKNKKVEPKLEPSNEVKQNTQLQNDFINPTQSKEVFEKEKIEETNPFISLYKNCLFQEIQSLSSEEVQILSTSFYERLKGKSKDKEALLIESQYLWPINNFHTSPALNSSSLPVVSENNQ